jgi:hypothetical protein
MTDQIEAHVPERREGKFSVHILEEICGQYLYGVYRTAEEAHSAMQNIVDTFLNENYEVGMTADELFEEYNWLGDHPCIYEHGDTYASVARAYAASRCLELCGSEVSKGTATNSDGYTIAPAAGRPTGG